MGNTQITADDIQVSIYVKKIKDLIRKGKAAPMSNEQIQKCAEDYVKQNYNDDKEEKIHYI